eukprot:Rhum_TRINITY_DN20673_c0_g1::Rhum_TRINITY_DN20673_c0_g1_i1::g.171770::m.171770/K08794/CAMK1; calcium/calmodulin-dependent protein kinase I
MLPLSLSDVCAGDITGVVEGLLRRYPALQTFEDPAVRYEEKKFLGSGTFGQVHRVVSRHDKGSEKFALKVVCKPGMERTRENCGLWKSLLTEIDVLAAVRHPNLVSLHDVMHSSDSFFIVMSHADGLPLQRFASQNPVSERDASEIANHVLRALHYLHSLSIVHSDIKPENIIITSNPRYIAPDDTAPRREHASVERCTSCKQLCPGPHPCCGACGRRNRLSPMASQTCDKFEVKLVDYGSVRIIRDRQEEKEAVGGSTMYIAMEVIDLVLPGGGGKVLTKELCKSDLYSLGVVVFMLLCRTHPFNGTVVDDLYQMRHKMRRGWEVPDEVMVEEGLSDDARGFLTGMLQTSPETRPNTLQALSHNFIMHRLAQSANCPCECLPLNADCSQWFQAPESTSFALHSSLPSSESLTSLQY